MGWRCEWASTCGPCGAGKSRLVSAAPMPGCFSTWTKRKGDEEDEMSKTKLKYQTAADRLRSITSFAEAKAYADKHRLVPLNDNDLRAIVRSNNALDAMRRGMAKPV